MLVSCDMTAISIVNIRLTTICFLSQILFFLLIHSSEGVIDSDKFSEFDWNLSKAVGSSVKDNVVLSPISLKLVLAMLYEGAHGNTSRQLEDTLSLIRETRAYTTHKFSEILKSLEEPSSEYDLDIGTKLFVEKKTQLNPQYEQKLSSVFNTSVQKVDFSNPGMAVKVINKWAESVTKGHIQDLITEADAKDSILLLLLNAIYFKGQWLQPFPSNQSRLASFNISPTQVIQTEFMNSIQTQKYTESEELDASLLRLPYMGNKYAMYIILPNEVDGLESLIKTLNPDMLRNLKNTMEDLEVTISLPKFHFDFATSFRPALEQLGLTDIFTEKANLTGITLNDKDNLMVSNVIQKAGILVNEKGSTAYVATQVDLVSKFGEHTVEFVADRPFLFFIEDETTSTVVFVGKLVNPISPGKHVVDKMSPDMVQNMRPMIIQPTLQDNDNQNILQQKWQNKQENTMANNSNSGLTNQNTFPTASNFQPGAVNMAESSSVGQGGIIEHSSNMQPGNMQPESFNNQPSEVQPTYPPSAPTVGKYPVYTAPISSSFENGGFYANNGEYIKQNFDQERFGLFDIELVQKLCNSEGHNNWVVSPASMKTVLGMIYEGSADRTELDLARILRLPRNKTRGLRMLHSVQRELHTPVKNGVQWLTANRLLVSNKLPILPEYRLAMSTMYHARVDPAKFESPVQTAQDINQWISNATRGFISSLVSPESLNPEAQMVIMNAVYFKGDWLYPFNNKYSQQQCFYPEPNNCKNVNMMNQRVFIKYGFYKQLYAHVIELPYSDTRFSMVIVLPEADGGLVDVIRDLPYSPILPFLNDITPAEVQLSLPSFSVEYFKDLSSIIAMMGDGSMFSNSADLRFMLGQKRGKISNIIHKAKIVVNEKGTQAGAGSGAIIVPLMNTQLIQISVNQPFLFYLRDQRTGFIFAGLISDPSMK